MRADSEDVAKLSPAYRPGRALKAFDTVYGSTEAVTEMPCMVCFAFTPGADTLAAANLYLPLDPNLTNDEEALTAVAALMRLEGIDPSAYRNLIRKLRSGLLHQSKMQSWVSCQIAGKPRVTTYVGPELYRGPSVIQPGPTGALPDWSGIADRKLADESMTSDNVAFARRSHAWPLPFDHRSAPQWRPMLHHPVQRGSHEHLIDQRIPAGLPVR